MAVLPSDPTSQMKKASRHLTEVLAVAHAGHVVTLGILPTHPERVTATSSWGPSLTAAGGGGVRRKPTASGPKSTCRRDVTCGTQIVFLSGCKRILMNCGRSFRRWRHPG